MKSNSTFKLQFNTSAISNLASQYDHSHDIKIESIGAAAKKQGYLTLSQLKELCFWKSPRSKGRVALNKDSFVRKITAHSFASKDEKERIETLIQLQGVAWPSASVILHLCHPDPYPILDVRAIESIGMENVSSYNFSFWWAYVEACRKISVTTGHDMRTIDRALWMFSKSK